MWNRLKTLQQYSTLNACELASLFACVIFVIFFTSNVTAKNGETSKITQSPTKDIRVLIDISGSMKKTDPNNLRQPAVKLFASLLPQEVFSGVWTFGKWVNMLIPHGLADSKWKALVHKQAININSKGLFTNIEEAMQRATWDWKESDSKFERTLIILSDGVVDISTNPIENSQSRSRILNNILPKLSNAKVKIHTIALSSLSDKTLLQQLSSATGGIHETIETTKDLDKTFLRIFNIATPRDELPLVDNKVKVDKSIKEITFLTFRKTKSSKTTITSPSGTTYNADKKIDGLIWHSENRYDLATIKAPETGTWVIDADVDPDNRVMVVTNLRFITEPIPNYVLVDTDIPLYAHLESENKIIKRRDFLHFIRMTAKLFGPDNEKQTTVKLKDNGNKLDEYKKDGVYSSSIKKNIILGKNKLDIVVNGTTFKRKVTQEINVVKYPVEVSLSVDKNNDISVSVIPYQTLIKKGSLKLSATHSTYNKEAEEYVIQKKSPAEWVVSIKTNNESGEHSIVVHIVGESNKNKSIEISTDPIIIAIGEDKKEEVKKDEDLMEIKPSDTVTDKPISWITVILFVVVFNIILISLIFLSYKLWGKYKYRIIPHPCEDMINV